MSKAAPAEDVRDPFENPDEQRAVEEVHLPDDNEKVGKAVEAAPKRLTKDERDEALRKIYTEATAELREQHRDEFNALRAQKAKARGIDWSPEPTRTEKELSAVEKMLADNPELAAFISITKPVGEQDS